MLGLFRRCTKASVAIPAAVAIVPILVVLGTAVDYSSLKVTQTRLQASADAAALAAAVSGGSTAERKAKSAAIFDKQGAKYGTSRELTPTVKIALQGSIATVQAEVEQPLSFLRVVGIDAKTVAVSAKAESVPGEPVCMLALDTTASNAITLGGNASITGKDCVIQSNSSATNAINFNGVAKALAKRFCGVGAFTQKHGFTPPPIPNCPEVDDPLLKVSASDSLAPCSGFATSYKKGTFNLQPGVYCGGLEALSQSDVRLAPGLYIIRDGQLRVQAQGSITGTGVTIYLTGTNAGLDLRGGGSMKISAPTSGPYKALAIVQDPDGNPGGTSVITGGGDVGFTGILYFPTQTVSLQGTGQVGANSPAWSLVAWRFSLQGTPDIVINSDYEAAGYGDASIKTKSHVILLE